MECEDGVGVRGCWVDQGLARDWANTRLIKRQGSEEKLVAASRRGVKLREATGPGKPGCRHLPFCKLKGPKAGNEKPANF